MPFVRYARDRRGYETLYVMHAFEGAGKNARVRVLYACRTVPYAKVGRQSIDEAVQRRIEQAYPALSFDWPRLLKEAAASAPRPERPDARAGEPRGKQRRERKPKSPGPQEQVRAAQPAPEEPRSQPLQEWAASDEPAALTEPVAAEEHPGPPEPEKQAPQTQEDQAVEEPVDAQDLEIVGPLTVDPSWPVVAIVGPQRALILRGRYIELAHRVLSRIEEPAERRRLLRDAARLNPETWKSPEEAKAAVELFEEGFSRLAEQLRRQPPV